MKIPRGRYFATTSELLRLLVDTAFFFNRDIHEMESELLDSTMSELTHGQPFIFVPSFRIGLFYTLKFLSARDSSRTQVLTTSITIPDAINAIKLNGLEARFIEMDEESHGVNIGELESALSGNTLAVVLTHLSGHISDEYEIIYKKCQQLGIIVIEDFSQAFGNSQSLKYADISIGSLSTGKTVSTLVGGIITSSNITFIDGVSKFKKINEKQNSIQRSMIFFQIIDSLKINFLCNRYIFSTLTYYALMVFKRIFPSSYSKLEQARTITRAINQDRFFENSFTKRDQFPDFFFFKLSRGQLKLYRQMLERLRVGNTKRAEVFNDFLNGLTQVAKDSIPKGFTKNTNNTYYHIPIKTNGRKLEIQNKFFEQGVDISSYGLPMCHSYFANQKLTITEEIKNQTLFIPLNEFSTPQDIKKVTLAMNNIYKQENEISANSLAPSSGK